MAPAAAYGDLSVLALSPDPDMVSSFAALDSASGDLHLMLINKMPSTAQSITLELANYTPAGGATLLPLRQWTD